MKEVVNAQCGKRLRSRLVLFNWKRIVCYVYVFGKSAKTDAHHPERYRYIRYVATNSLMGKNCRKRGDTWAFEIQDRFHGCIDLVAAEAVYHDSCFFGLCPISN